MTKYRGSWLEGEGGRREGPERAAARQAVRPDGRTYFRSTCSSGIGAAAAGRHTPNLLPLHRQLRLKLSCKEDRLGEDVKGGVGFIFWERHIAQRESCEAVSPSHSSCCCSAMQQVSQYTGRSLALLLPTVCGRCTWHHVLASVGCARVPF